MAVTDTMQDTTNFAEAMKIRYAKKISDTINRKVVLHGYLMKTKESWTGKHHETPVYLRSANSVGSRNEGGTLPSGAPDVYQSSKINNAYNYVVMKVTNIGDAETADQAGAWANMKTAQLKNRAKDITDSINRQLWWGSEGILAEVKSVAGAGPYDVTIAGYGDTLANDAGYAPDTTKFLKTGLRVSWGQYDGGVQFAHDTTVVADGHGYVSGVTKADPYNVCEITVTAGNAPAADDIIVIGNGLSEATNSFNKEMTGLRQCVDDGTGSFQDISATTYPEWKAQVFESPAGAGTERPLTEDLLNQAIDSVNDLATDDCDLAGMHTATRRAYLNMLKAKGAERFSPAKLVGGFKALMYFHDGKEIPFFSDRMAPHRDIYLLSRSHFKIYETKPFTWDESGGAVWKWVSGEDAVTAFGKTYCNLGTDNRAASARVSDIAVTGLVQ